MPPLGNPLEAQNSPQATPGVMSRALTDAQPLGDAGGDVPISPQERAELERMIMEVDNAVGKVRSTKDTGQMAVNNEMMQQQIFELLQMAGVDLNDPNSVNQFLETIKQTNPDLGEVVEMVLEDVFKDIPYENQESPSVPAVPGVPEAIPGYPGG